ncbi:AmmeMemoRadiSam system radical SAM enzyme [Candidatus Bathyarchaeota archaeon]|nr:AmmeMemoRadiSam system radical SAM enzyme [Candidatus Bathyarchaeota archaeon]
MLNSPTVREALLYEVEGEGMVRCLLCGRGCVIPDGGEGFCGTRRNVNGRLYTMVYGDVSSISANPIEKKPFYHFWPGSLALTVGSWSCNFTCPWCQNWEISKVKPDPCNPNFISVKEFMELMGRMGCNGTSMSFNEPTLLFEYSLDLFREASKKGYYNTFVSNGYMSEGALRMLASAGLDAINIDVKGDGVAVEKFCGADLEIVWRNIGLAKRLGLHVEVVTLVIPGVNSSPETLKEIAIRLLAEAGPDTPIHFTRFHPSYRMTDRPSTDIKLLEGAREIAVREGVNYAYVGNVPGHPYENTYCPKCGGLLLARLGFSLIGSKVLDGRFCASCGEEIPIKGKIRLKRPIP